MWGRFTSYLTRAPMSDQPQPPAGEDARRFWVFFVLLGALLALGGICALLLPQVATDVAIFVWGCILLARGVVEVAGSFLTRRGESFLLHLAIGILSLVVGGLILLKPDTAEKALTLILAAFFLVGGIAQAVAAVVVRHHGWAFGLVAGLVGVLIGVSLFNNYPENAPWVIGAFVGIDLIFRGASWIGFGLNVKNAPVG